MEFVSDFNKNVRQTGEMMYPMGKPNEHLIHDRTISVNTVTYPSTESEISFL